MWLFQHCLQIYQVFLHLYRSVSSILFLIKNSLYVLFLRFLVIHFLPTCSYFICFYYIILIQILWVFFPKFLDILYLFQNLVHHCPMKFSLGVNSSFRCWLYLCFLAVDLLMILFRGWWCVSFSFHSSLFIYPWVLCCISWYSTWASLVQIQLFYVSSWFCPTFRAYMLHFESSSGL